MLAPAKVKVSGKTYPVREKLRRAGLSWDGKAWVGTLTRDRLERFRDFCRTWDLEYTIVGDQIKESLLARGQRPIELLMVPAVMGEGRLQWAITETLSLDCKRHYIQKHRKPKRFSPRRRVP